MRTKSDTEIETWKPNLFFFILLFAQFLEGKLYKVECQAHARNIIIDAKANLGSIKFEYQYGGDLVAEED